MAAFALIRNPYAKSDPRFGGEEFRVQAIVMLVTVAVSTAAWLAVTFLTKPEEDEKLAAFYQRVQPGGAGWRALAHRCGLAEPPADSGTSPFLLWGLGVVLVYSALFGIGKLVFGEVPLGVGLLAVAVAAFVVIIRNIDRR